MDKNRNTYQVNSCLFLLLFFFSSLDLLGGVQFWVDPEGSDTNPGSKDLPFATLPRAKAAVRSSLATGVKGRISVNVHGGLYRLDSPLRFDVDDCSPKARVTYRAVKGETPVVTGAISVTGWQKVAGRLYKADLSAVLPSSTRQLYVNGKRAIRARTPDYPASFNPYFSLVGGEWTTPGIQFIPNPILNPTIPDPAGWANSNKIEALIITQWKMSFCRIEKIFPSVDLGGGVILPGLIELQEPGWSNANIFRDRETGKPSIWSFWQVTRFENAIEFLDSPGEWYFDESTNILYYMPLWIEDLSTAKVEMPQLETLIDISGTPGNPVRNLTFEGFTFKGATWNAPSSAEGYVADQSGFHLTGVQDLSYIGHSKNVTRTPGNITLSYATKISFKYNTFEQLGGVAIDLVTGCVKNLIHKNLFRDISSAAVQIGGVAANDARPLDTASICRQNVVSDNRIYRTGQDYLDSAAIFVGFTQKTLITHNTIIDVPWSGIAIGWGWGLMDEGEFLGLLGAVKGQWGTFNTPTIASNNKITYNQISGFLNKLWDGGAIYTTGQQGPNMSSGTKITGNVAFGKRLFAGGNTFYTDGGSRYLKLRSNVSYDNPVGITYFGPSPNPLDPLPYPNFAASLNDIPYGSETGGCRTYGDIRYLRNYWLSPDFFSVCPYTDNNGVSYPINMKYSRNHTIKNKNDVPHSLLRRAGSSLLK